ncbi:MAG: GNAT family N-acetyltransferase, partial [Flavobacteriales bacterium]
KVTPKIVDFGFEKFGIERIYARVYGRNLGSQKVLKNCGFQFEGQFEKTIFKNGKFEDEIIYSVRRNKWKK